MFTKVLHKGRDRETLNNNFQSKLTSGTSLGRVFKCPFYTYQDLTAIFSGQQITPQHCLICHQIDCSQYFSQLHGGGKIRVDRALGGSVPVVAT